MVHSLQTLSAIVTGGASGLGAVISRRLGAEGVNVCINGLPSDQAAAEVLCKEISDANNVKCTFIVADISSAEACAGVVDHAVKTLGGLDIIIANAGWTRHAAWSDLDAFSEADWLKSFKINTLVSSFYFQPCIL
jgi:NAD(P)-dependent dehydrogenase (short-subunit alcohol dehydrogenase family)